jgi:hypothetical protein
VRGLLNNPLKLTTPSLRRGNKKGFLFAAFVTLVNRFADILFRNPRVASPKPSLVTDLRNFSSPIESAT